MSEPSRDAVAKALKWFDSDHFLPSHEGCVLAREVRRLEAELGRRGAAPDGLLREAADALILGTGSYEWRIERDLLVEEIDAALSALLDAPPEKNLGTSRSVDDHNSSLSVTPRIPK